jgi:hypothetical protein
MTEPASPAETAATEQRAYFVAVRADLDEFARRKFGLAGTWRLHRHALGLDILRAPLNVFLSPVLVLCRLLAALCAGLRLRRVARWLRGRRILLRTDVAAQVEAALVRDALRVALPDGDTPDTTDLARAILAAPPFQHGPHPSDARNKISNAIAEYSGTRSAVADITNALFAVIIGGLVFQAVTPGMISMAPNVARAIAQETAISNFLLGETAGTLWYGVFTPDASAWLLAANIAGLLLVGSVIGAFAGLVADPVQVRLGIHQRRLLRFVAAIEDELVGSRTKRYSSNEHFYARFMDVWDAVVSVWRFFRN